MLHDISVEQRQKLFIYFPVFLDFVQFLGYILSRELKPFWSQNNGMD